MPITLPWHCSGCVSTRDKRPGPGWSWDSVVEHLLNKHEALGSIPRTDQKQPSPPSSCLYYILLIMYVRMDLYTCMYYGTHTCSEGNSLTMILYLYQGSNLGQLAWQQIPLPAELCHPPRHSCL